MTPSQRRSLGTLFIVALLCSASACSDKRTNLGAPDGAMPGDGDGDGDGSGGSGGSGDGDGDGDGTGGSASGDGDGDGDVVDGGQAFNPDGSTLFPDGGMIPDELLLCGGVSCVCLDGIDNDGDGEVDGFDTECTGANDNDEGSFATGIPGDNVDPKWQDCFFDGNSGAGDDGCRYSTDCISGELPQDHKNCTVTDQCVEFCAPRTPNGCDCFGCCDVTRADGSSAQLMLGDECSLAVIDDIAKCPPCI